MSLLAAVVLYIFAIGVVKGFAFALGISTRHRPRGVLLVHQADGVLARPFKFFNSGAQAVRAVAARRSASTTGLAPRVRLEGTPDGQVLAASATPSTRAEVSIDFVGRKWLWYSISGADRARWRVVGLLVKGLNFGIEFEGGVEYRVIVPPAQVTQDNADEIRDAVAGDRHRRRRRRRSSTPPATTTIRVQTEPLTNDREPTQISDGDPGGRRASTSDAISSQTRSAPTWGAQVAKRALIGLRRLPGPGGAVHLGLLPRVEDVRRRDRRAGPRPAHHGRRLRAVRLRGHAGDGHRHPDHPRLLALRHRRGLRQGAREHQEPRAQPHRPTPRRPTSRSTRPWSGRSTPRSWRCSRSARSSTSASSSSAPARSRTSRSRCSSAWRPAPTPRSSSPPRCWCSSRSASPASSAGDARPLRHRSRHEVDRYASVPAFTEDMPLARRARATATPRTAGAGRPRRRRRPAACAREAGRARGRGRAGPRRGPVSPVRVRQAGAADPQAAVAAGQEVSVTAAVRRSRRARCDRLVRDVPDFPEPGVVFKDITPLLADHDGFTAVVEALAAAGRDADGTVVVDKVVGMEARGFILAAPGRAGPRRRLRAGPQGRQAAAARRTRSPTRWSTARRPSRCTATRIAPGERVLLVDDVLATGGTADATRAAGRAVRRRRARRRGAAWSWASCPAATPIGDLPAHQPADRLTPTPPAP